MHGLLFDSDSIKNEYRSEVSKALKSHATFFKHAQRDPDASIEFHPKINEFLMLYTINGLARMNVPQGQEEEAFSLWFWLNNTRYYSAEFRANLFLIQAIEEINRLSKGDFFREFCAQFQKRPGACP